MSWTEITRRQYRRDGLRYASDLTDEEWTLIAAASAAGQAVGAAAGDRPARGGERDALRADDRLPVAASAHEFPALHHGAAVLLRLARRRHLAADQPSSAAGAREAMGREASPSAGVIDSQSVKTTEAGGPRGYDAGKKIKGRKRHILTDTNGLLVAAIVHAADIQDRDGAVPLLASIRHAVPLAAPRLRRRRLCRRPSCRRRWPHWARGRWRSSSAPTSPRASSSCRRRWVVERTLAWLNRNRRLAKDFEALIETAAAWLMLASVKLLIRRLARG